MELPLEGGRGRGAAGSAGCLGRRCHRRRAQPTSGHFSRKGNCPAVCYLGRSFSSALIFIAQVFKEEKYLKDAVECSDVIWQRGLLRKGYGICHGTAGNGYSFLSLYHITQDKKYLYRACKVRARLSRQLLSPAEHTKPKQLWFQTRFAQLAVSSTQPCPCWPSVSLCSGTGEWKCTPQSHNLARVPSCVFISLMTLGRPFLKPQLEKYSPPPKFVPKKMNHDMGRSSVGAPA